MSTTERADAATLTIGVVIAETGRLATLGEPLTVAMALVEPLLRHITNAGRRYPVRLVSRDSRSDPEHARAAVRELAGTERANVVLTLAGTQVLPAVADTCETLGVPCVSSAFPWQVYYYGRGGQPFRWTYHFCWGIDDIATTFAEMWELLGDGHRVGCLWNDGPQGEWTRHPVHGFPPVATARGHHLVDPGAYHEPAESFERHVAAFRDADVDVVTSASTAADLALFRDQANRDGLRPRLLTCSRWLAYPLERASTDPATAQVATLVYWSPHHPYLSSLDGMPAAELAEVFQARTGHQWLQPLGLAYALFEVAAHALATAADPTDRASVARAIAASRVRTMAGLLDWTAGPVPNVAPVRLAGGQWLPGRDHPYELAVVTNTHCPQVTITADLRHSA